MNSLSHSASRGRSDYFRKWRRINTVITLALGLSAVGACTSVGPVTNERVTQHGTRSEAPRNIGPARVSAIASTETLRHEIERNAVAPTSAEPRIKL
jgi:hypothetical protein